MPQTQTFEEWFKEADLVLQRNLGVSLNDLPDQCFRDWYDGGMSPGTAAYKALKASSDEMFMSF